MSNDEYQHQLTWKKEESVFDEAFQDAVKGMINVMYDTKYYKTALSMLTKGEYIEDNVYTWPLMGDNNDKDSNNSI